MGVSLAGGARHPVSAVRAAAAGGAPGAGEQALQLPAGEVGLPGWWEEGSKSEEAWLADLKKSGNVSFLQQD